MPVVLINMTVLFLSFKQATTVPKKIDQQSVLQTAEKENTHHIPITLTLHPHDHIVKSIILKTLITPKRFRDWYYLFTTSTNVFG